MTVRGDILACVTAGKPPEEITELIMGFLSVRCGLDNGNGWYDDDPAMADDGLEKAEVAWAKFRVSIGKASPLETIMAGGEIDDATADRIADELGLPKEPET